jgi:hypothetical protein
MEKPDPKKARLAKAHSSVIADLYVKAGWVVRTEFRVAGDDEPYEYILEMAE